jgi:hypothetical protein
MLNVVFPRYHAFEGMLASNGLQCRKYLFNESDLAQTHTTTLRARLHLRFCVQIAVRIRVRFGAKGVL